VAQQGFPPGRHSRGPHPGDAPYGGETPHREASHAEDAPYREAPYAEDAPYREARHAEDAPYREAPYSGEVPYQDDALQPGHGSRPDRRVRPERGIRPDRSGRSDHGERHDRARRADRQRPQREAWQQTDPFSPGSDTDADLPPWAGPTVYPGRPTGTLQHPAPPRRHDDTDHRELADEADRSAEPAADGTEGETRSRRRRGRAAATRLRKSRRRVYRFGGIAIAACVVIAGVVAIVTHHSPKPLPYVTSLQRGEFTSVPNACTSVSTSVLNQFLPGTGRTTTSTLASSTNSQCSFTVDARPNFLVMQVQAESYQPFAAATADGSATGNAQDNFAVAQLALAHPPKRSPLPPAQITKVTGLGQQAFMAFQSEHVTGIATDIVTLVVRERNVVITASLSGQESGHGFGPVPVSTLQAGARAAAQAVLAKVMTQPTA
jgi:hypothetical protein